MLTKKFKKLNLQLISFTLCFTLLSACGIYKPQIAQGNIVTAAQLATLKVGMNRQQVQQALGSPLLQDVFNATRWDYVYRTLSGKGVLEQRVLTVFFNADNTVNRWTGQEAPNLNPLNTNLPTLPSDSNAASSNNMSGQSSQLKTPLTADVVVLGSNSAVIPLVTPVNALPTVATSPTAVQSIQTSASSTTQSIAVAPVMTVIDADIQATIESWRSAWESKDLSRYAAHYTSDFKGEAANPVAWLASRKRIIDDAGVIVLKVSNFNVIQTANDEARASFTQSYQSRRLTEIGEKSLFFKRVGNEWKIIAERFIKQN